MRPDAHPGLLGRVERRARSRGTSDLERAAAAVLAAPDEVLARRAALGDKTAFAEIVSRHGAALYRYVSRLLDDPHDAQDCVQEVMLSAWKNLSSFRGDSSVRTWLLVIGRNEAQKISRRRQPQFPAAGSVPAVDFDAVVADMRDRHADPEGNALEAELLAALDAALSLLPERQRSVWVLREIEHLSYDDIATVVGVSPTAARGLLQRARAGIATSLEEWR